MFKPKYQITDQQLSWLSDIAEIRAKIAQLQLSPVRETLLRRRAVIKIAHSSTSIEGNGLSEQEVEKLASKSPIVAPAKDQLEVNNYFAALDALEKFIKKPGITMATILELHGIVMQGLLPAGKAGQLRAGPVYIVNTRPGYPDRVIYTPPPAEVVTPLLQDLLAWHNQAKSVHPIIRASILHYQFESIHPFPDGNGRVGRLLALLSLYQNSWDFRRGLVLEEYYNLDRRAYYLALQAGRNNLTDWLSYFVEGFWVEALRLQESTLSLISGGGALTGRTLDSADLKIIDFALSLGKISSRDASDILSLPLRTAQYRLTRLVKYRILKKLGSGPATVYLLRHAKE